MPDSAEVKMRDMVEDSKISTGASFSGIIFRRLPNGAHALTTTCHYMVSKKECLGMPNGSTSQRTSNSSFRKATKTTGALSPAAAQVELRACELSARVGSARARWSRESRIPT